MNSQNIQTQTDPVSSADEYEFDTNSCDLMEHMRNESLDENLYEELDFP